MERQRIQSLVESLQAHKAGAAARGGVPGDCDEPRFVWSPEPSEVDADVLAFLLNYWLCLPRRDDLPLASEFRYVDMAFALGNLMVLDVVDEGWDYRYLYYGPEIVAATGESMSGRRASELDPTNAARPFLLAAYRAVVLRREPLFTEHTMSSLFDPTRQLILPLSAEDDGGVSQLLVGLVPGQQRVLEQDERSVA